MITGDIKGRIDRFWDAFWSGGISNPLEAIEQITYLPFIRRLDDLQTLAENRARLTKTEVQSPVFLPGQAHLRWGSLKNEAPEVMHRIMGEEVFPFLPPVVASRYERQPGPASDAADVPGLRRHRSVVRGPRTVRRIRPL